MLYGHLSRRIRRLLTIPPSGDRRRESRVSERSLQYERLQRWYTGALGIQYQAQDSEPDLSFFLISNKLLKVPDRGRFTAPPTLSERFLSPEVGASLK